MIKNKLKVPPESEMWRIIFDPNKPTKINPNYNSIQWQIDVPFDIRNNAVRDAYKTYEAVSNKWKNGEKAMMSYRRKRSSQQAILLPKSCLREKTFYVSYMGDVVKANHPLMSDGDTRLVKTLLGYELHVITKSLIENQDHVHNVISLDPGVRTFMTGFDNNGIVDICDKVERLCRLKNAYYNVRYKMKSVNARKRQRMRKASLRINKRIRNLVDEMHWKTIKYLTDNYSDIILPEFNVKQMTCKTRRRINKRTVQSMLLLSHYKFRDRLVSKALTKNVKVWISNESYTSKTCTNCGFEHNKLGGSKTFNCPSCKTCVDRDVNGARNIMLRVMQ